MRFFKRRVAPSENLDQQLVFQLSKSRIPTLRQLKYIGRYLSRMERSALIVCIALAIASAGFLGVTLYNHNFEIAPQAGGQYTEGAVGNPRYVNPLYASLNPIDADLEQLIFSRLFTKNEKGEIIPDLVSAYELSADQKTYTLHLRQALWPTGVAVNADDVVFTFNLIQDPEYRSPLRDVFSGVTVQSLDDATVAFTLKEPYGKFPSLLNFGILPSALWEGVSAETIPLAELNIKPVGSGPYRFKSLVKNNIGTVRSYTLERNPDYYGHKPYLDEIMFKFFPSAEEMIAALNNGQLQGLSSLPSELADSIVAKNSLSYHQLIQPNITALFFNFKNVGRASDPKVRQALNIAIDRNSLLDQSGQKGIIASGPLPQSPLNGSANMDAAKKLLDEAGWNLKDISEADIAAAKTAPSKASADFERLGAGQWRIKGNEGLIVNVTAPNSLKSVAEAVVATWKTLGVKTQLSLQDDAGINDKTIANRQFEIVLYTAGMSGGDPYPFWHSTASTNLSGYNRSDVDHWLEEARLSSDPAIIADRYKKFESAIATDIPAIFLYWHTTDYPQTKKLKGFSTTLIESASDRLLGVSTWYLKTEHNLKQSK